jgi:hypothetical protein
MDDPEKLATSGTQDEEYTSKNTEHGQSRETGNIRHT